MSKRAKWVVEAKIENTREELEEYCKGQDEDPDDYEMDDSDEVEISVVRVDNKFGQESYGWGGMDKIILFEDGEGYTEENIKWMKEVAQTVCDALNEKDL